MLPTEKTRLSTFSPFLSHLPPPGRPPQSQGGGGPDCIPRLPARQTSPGYQVRHSPPCPHAQRKASTRTRTPNLPLLITTTGGKGCAAWVRLPELSLAKSASPTSRSEVPREPESRLESTGGRHIPRTIRTRPRPEDVRRRECVRSVPSDGVNLALLEAQPPLVTVELPCGTHAWPGAAAACGAGSPGDHDPVLRDPQSQSGAIGIRAQLLGNGGSSIDFWKPDRLELPVRAVFER